MTQPDGGAALKAAQMAVALVAACRAMGVAPDQAFEAKRGHRRARILAAAGCVARLGWRTSVAARRFQLEPKRLAPSTLKAAGLGVEDLLDIAEALAAAGLTAGDGPTNPPPGPPKAKAERPRAETGARAAGAPAASQTPQVKVAEGPAAARAGPVWAKPRAVAANPVCAVPVAGGIERLKPVTARIARWARAQLALGADLMFVAWCFGVHPDAVVDAIAQLDAPVAVRGLAA